MQLSNAHSWVKNLSLSSIICLEEKETVKRVWSILFFLLLLLKYKICMILWIRRRNENKRAPIFYATFFDLPFLCLSVCHCLSQLTIAISSSVPSINGEKNQDERLELNRTGGVKKMKKKVYATRLRIHPIIAFPPKIWRFSTASYGNRDRDRDSYLFGKSTTPEITQSVEDQHKTAVTGSAPKTWNVWLVFQSSLKTYRLLCSQQSS